MSWLHPLHQGWRALRQSPGFSLVAVLTLALGVGANTAVFSVVDAVLLRPLPYPQANRLIEIRESSASFPSMSDSFPDYLDWARQQHVFTQFAAYQGDGWNLTGQGSQPEMIEGANITANLFSVLGVAPRLGHGILPAEDHPGGRAVAVLSYGLFQRRFGGDAHWLGRGITLDNQLYTIVGVMPPGFNFPNKESDIWLSLGRNAPPPNQCGRGCHPGIGAMGRLAPGVTLARAQAAMSTIAARLARTYPKTNTGEGVHVITYLDWMVGGTRPGLWVLLFAVGMVLLIACANIANLLLARAATRRKEFAIRSTLGASRRQVIAQVLSESLTLALLGGAAGLLLAWVGIRLAVPLLPTDLPRLNQLGIDWRVLAFTLAAALASGVLFGLAPAWQNDGIDVHAVLKEGGRSGHAGRAGARVRSALVVAEMALALLLLAGAGLLLRSFYLLLHASPGFDPANIATFSLGLPDTAYSKDAQQVAFFRQALARLATIPGVTHAAIVEPLPFGSSDWEDDFQLPDRAAFPPGHEPSADMAMVSPDYFKTMRIPLLQGRFFTASDDANAPQVAIVDDTFARRYWPHESALGKQIGLGKKPWTIVGIVPHVETQGLDGASVIDRLPEMWVPYFQLPNDSVSLVLRAAPGIAPLSLVPAARARIQSLDANLPTAEVHTLAALVGGSLAPRRLSLLLVGCFAALALLLSAVGIYSVMSYTVAQRAHDIGIRMALGAQRGDVIRMVLGQGFRLALAGAALGLLGALLLAKTIAGFLFGVRPSDPATFAAISFLLLAVALLASYLPARRATAVNPLVALRSE